jgi:hypothetical protein
LNNGACIPWVPHAPVLRVGLDSLLRVFLGNSQHHLQVKLELLRAPQFFDFTGHHDADDNRLILDPSTGLVSGPNRRKANCRALAVAAKREANGQPPPASRNFILHYG